MVSSDPSASMNSDGQRQLQCIAAFKDKVADLRATSRVYNITSDVSINTLDSSLATKTVDSSSSFVEPRKNGSNSVDVVVRNAGKTLTESMQVISRLSSMEEKRSPVEQETDEDNDSSASGSFSDDSVESRLSPPQNSTSGDDADEGDSKDSFDGALFSELRNAMFKRKTESNDMMMDDEKDIVSPSRPESVASRSTSQASKQSIADASGVSASTHSTFGGFSIECIEEDESDDSVELVIQTEEEVESDPPVDATTEHVKSLVSETIDRKVSPALSIASSLSKPEPASCLPASNDDEEEKEDASYRLRAIVTPESETIDRKLFSGLSITSSLSSKSKPVVPLFGNNDDDEATDEGYSYHKASRRLRELVAIISQDDFIDKALSTEPIDKLFSGQSVNSSLSSSSKPMACLLEQKDDDVATDEGYAHNNASRRLRELAQLRQMEDASSTPEKYGKEESEDEAKVEEIEQHNASQRLRRLLEIGKECIDDGSDDSKGSVLIKQKAGMADTNMTMSGQLQDEEANIGDIDVIGTTTDINHNDSMSSMTDQPPTAAPLPQAEVVLASSSNPFAVLLKLRQARKMAVSNMLAESVGSIVLGPSSDGDSTMSSLSAFKSETGKKTFPKVYADADDADDMLERVLFSNLKQSLPKIQSVEYEDSFENVLGEEEKGTPCETEQVKVEEEDDEDEVRHPTGVASSVVVNEMESCAISSLKDDTYAIRSLMEVGGELNDDPFLDDDDEVHSVPTSPADLEDYRQFQTSIDSTDSSDTDSFDSASISVESCKLVEDKLESLHKVKTARKRLTSNNDDDSETVALSNSNKVDYMKEKERETTLTPPKRNVIISDGSVFTKDSILGKTINVATADLATERIFLESLRAQVLAELKVHVADEEIRAALDSRLKAIQTYYKRKATVVTLSKTPNATASSRNENDEFLNSLGKIPKVQRTAIYDNKLPAAPQAQPLSSNANPSPHQQQHSHQFAFERAQGKMDEAIRAAHKKGRKDAIFPQVDDDEVKPTEEKTSIHSEAEPSIPEQIFMKDTFWDDEDDPSSAGVSPGTAADEGYHPPTHSETIQNAWNFYRDINNLIFDSRVYDYEFQLIQDDPLYPYLNSLLGVADSGEVGGGQELNHISQQVKPEYADKSAHRICHILAKEAKDALPELKEICAYLGEKLGMQTMAVGPMKTASEALLKCERKYGGDPLLVTDFCRASLFVKDIATLLALIEIVLSEYGQILRRIKLSSLKSDHVPLTGGYRDCKINLDIGGHICEIQVHLIPLWLIKEGSGYKHYKKCCDHSVTLSSFDIGKTLDGLSRSVLGDLIDIAKDELKSTPIVSLQKDSEDKIRDYFALACMYQCYGQPAKAEYILRRTVKLRSESREFGLYHNETMLHLEVLRKSLKSQHKYKSSMKIKSQITKMKRMQRRGDVDPELSQLCSEDQCGALDHLCDLIIDPSKLERRREKLRARDVEESRALWLRMRKSFFS